jgi:pyruvate/2-oxoglutarate dehydrogenase complex dihydrolipoamide acyltransferase (E2) component
MKVALKMPMFGMNMDEATIVKWHRTPGDAFRKGEPLYEVETEKVTTEVPAPCDGSLLEIHVPVDSSAAAGAAVCTIDWR